jgi:predicted DCC family thiol-disulfide oxidoreductase YuxK
MSCSLSGPASMVEGLHPEQIAPVLVFDGVCVLCSGWVKWVMLLDQSRQIRFATLQSDTGRRLAAMVTGPEEGEETLVFAGPGFCLARSAAVWEILRRFPVWVRWLRIFRFLPVYWQDGLYRFTARNRYRIFGRRSTCFVPGPAERERFLHN